MAARWHVRLVLVAFVAARSESNVTLSANDTTRECFTPTVACAYSEAAPRLVRVVAGILGSRGAIPGGDAAVTGDLSGDGSPATATRLRTPRSVAVDVRARALYVVDQDDSAVRRVDLLTGHLSLLAGIRTPTELELGTGQISMLVGTRGSAGPEGDKGHPNLAQLRSPMGVAVDTISQTLYIADTGNHVVRMLDLSTGDMVVVAGIAGRGGFCGESGLATETCLRFPRAVAVDAVARELYVADTHNHVVRLINLTSGDISTLAGTPRYGGRRTGTTGVATSAQLFFPNDVAVDPVWRQLFIADTNNHAIRLVDLATGMLSTIAGVFGVYGYSGDGGLGAAAHFNMPDSVTVDPAARQLYVADTQNHVVRRVDLWTGKVFTIAGVPTYPGLVDEGGPATAARLYLPTGISVEWDPQAMQRLIVNPPEHARTYSSSASSNTGSMLNGSQAWLGIERGPNSTEWMQVDLEIVRIVTGIIVQGQAGLHSDQGVTSVEVWHSTDNASWSAVPANLTRRTPLSAEEQLVFPRPVQARHIRFLAKGWNGQIAMRAGVEVIDFMQARLLYVADSNNYVARVVDLASHAMSTIVGLLGTYGNGTLDGSLAAASSLHQPRGVAVDSMRKLLYVADTSNHVIRRVDLTSGVLSTPVGVVQQAGALGDGGPATSAELHLPYGVAVDPVAQKLYVADTGNHAVRVYSTEDSGTLNLQTIAGMLGSPGLSGDGGLATAAQLRSPYGIAVDSGGQRLFVADTMNHAVRLVNLASGQISRLAGDGTAKPGRKGDGGPATSAQLSFPYTVALDLITTSKSLYIADSSNHAVRRVDLNTGTLTTVAGILGSPGHEGDGDPAISAKLYFPYGIALDAPARRLYIADNFNHAIRLVDLASGTLLTVAGVLGVYGISGDGGRATWAHLHSPMGIAMDSEAQQLFIADADNHAVRRLVVSNDLRVDGW